MPELAYCPGELGRRWWVCLGIFTALVVWAIYFPFSGDGDSVLHYLNALDTSRDISKGLFAWTRPGYKIPMSLFAAHGIMAAHVFNAFITTAAAWNTMRLAEQLRIPRPWLAGLFLFLQPYVFALGSDTMTEMPMALGLVLSVRWWLSGNYVLSCLMAGYLPSVRPEGFFFGLIFGVMVIQLCLRDKSRTPGQSWPHAIGRMAVLLLCLSAGLALWVFLCWYFAHDALLVLHYWSWPPGSYAGYGKGPLLHYVINWPRYCGLPLFILFVAGIWNSVRRSMILPWAAWGTVIGVHSVLYWGGWFASCGLIRIMACSSPITAVVCLYGWNTLSDSMPRSLHKPVLGLTVFLAGLWVIGNYCLDRERMHFLPLQRCAAFIRSNHLLDNKPYFFAGDKIATAMLHGPNLPDDKLMAMPCDKHEIAKNLAALPLGSIGVWDTEQAPVWHGYTIGDLTSHGYTLLYDTHVHVYSFTSLIRGYWWLDMRYVVLRKDANVGL